MIFICKSRVQSPKQQAEPAKTSPDPTRGCDGRKAAPPPPRQAWAQARWLARWPTFWRRLPATSAFVQEEGHTGSRREGLYPGPASEPLCSPPLLLLQLLGPDPTPHGPSLTSRAARLWVKRESSQNWRCYQVTPSSTHAHRGTCTHGHMPTSPHPCPPWGHSLAYPICLT